jgi:hypothetical protein
MTTFTRIGLAVTPTEHPHPLVPTDERVEQKQ